MGHNWPGSTRIPEPVIRHSPSRFFSISGQLNVAPVMLSPVSRLYRYVDGAEKTGYFIIGDEGDAAFQVTPVAKHLFDAIGYNPPTKPEGTGSKVPGDLHWALFDVGWIYTGGGESGQEPPGMMPNNRGQSLDLSDQMASDLVEFLQENERQGAEELSERLMIKNRAANRLSSLGEKEQGAVEGFVYGYLEAALTGGRHAEAIDRLDVTYLDLSDDEETGSLNVHIDPEGDGARCRHTIDAREGKGVTSIITATEAPASWVERARLDRHRSELFQVIEDMSNHPESDIAFPDGQVKGEITYHTSFEMNIKMPD